MLRHATGLTLAYAVAVGIAGWITPAHSAEGIPAASTDIETEQGAMESEIKRLTEERKRLEAKEQELQKTIKEQSQRLLEQQRALDVHSRMIEEQQHSFDVQKQRLEELRIKSEELGLPAAPQSETPKSEITPPAPAPTPPPPQVTPVPVLPSPNAPPSVPPTPPAVQEVPTTGPVGRAPQPDTKRPAQVADILEQRGILTPRGTLVVEPSLQYVNSSVTHVALEGYTIIPAITIGSIDISSVDRNTLTPALALRYGVTNRFEVEMQVPYVFRDDHTTTRPLATPATADTITTITGDHLGDVEFGVNYQLNQGKQNSPYYVANLRAKSRTGEDPFGIPTDPNTGLQTRLPTGSGFWSIQPAINVSLPSDPAVFFGNLSYMWNIQRKVNDTLGTIDPGDALGISFGMGMALNEDSSFSLGYSHSSVAETRQGGKTVKGSRRLQVGTLLIGMSHRAGARSNINFGLGIGVTDDAPNAQVSVSVPVNVELRK